MSRKYFICLFALLFTFESHSASLGTYRIYLDNNNRTQKFPVRNRTNKTEKCEVGFKYLAYDGKGHGELLKLTENEQANLSQPVLERIRFSPQSFKLEPNTIQYIAFSLRRSVSEETSEKRTYASITCKDAKSNSKTGLSTALDLTVPLVVRTGRSEQLDAELELKKLSENKIRLHITGDRSVYGNINLVNRNGELIRLLERNTVIYPEMTYRDYSLPELKDQNVKLQFVETGKYTNNQTFNFEL